MMVLHRIVARFGGFPFAVLRGRRWCEQRRFFARGNLVVGRSAGHVFAVFRIFAFSGCIAAPFVVEVAVEEEADRVDQVVQRLGYGRRFRSAARHGQSFSFASAFQSVVQTEFRKLSRLLPRPRFLQTVAACGRPCYETVRLASNFATAGVIHLCDWRRAA